MTVKNIQIKLKCTKYRSNLPLVSPSVQTSFLPDSFLLQQLSRFLTHWLVRQAPKGLEKANKLELERGFFCLFSVWGFFWHSATASLLQPVQNSLHEAPRLSQKSWCLCNHYPLFTVSDKKQRKIGAQQQKCSRKNLGWPPTFRSWG